MIRNYIAWLLLLISYSLTGMAQESANNTPVEITAKKFYYDLNEKRAHATGQAEVIQGQQLLNADRVLYHQQQDKLLAEGDISLLRPDGSIIFADKAQLERQMYRGRLLRFYVRLPEKGLLAGNSAEVIDQNHMQVNKVVYSPCRICASNIKPYMPLWQIKAEQAEWDKEKQEIIYHNARMEALGVPFLYTPYLSMPAPNADRRSGLLMPSPHWSNHFGISLQIPYYINIKPEMDATITPWLNTSNGHLLEGEFRHLTEYGKYQLHGTIINTNKYTRDGKPLTGRKEVKAHIEATGEFSIPAISDNTFVGFDITRVNDSSRTYLKKYRINQDDILRQNFFMRHFHQYNYLLLDTLHFQSLRPQDNWHESPRALPWLRMGYNYALANNNGEIDINADILNLQRHRAVEYKRFSTTAGYSIPFTLPYGQLVKLAANLRMDAYDTTINLKNPEMLGKVPRKPTKLYPNLQVDWSLPLINFSPIGTIILEPMAQVIISPNFKVADNAVNEDSKWFELSAFNLFQPNRFLGIDRLETGSRINYAIKASLSNQWVRSASVLFGKVYNFQEHPEYDYQSGLYKHNSDYVSAINVQVTENTHLLNKMRFASSGGKILRNDVYALYTQPKWNIGVTYSEVNKRLLNPDIQAYPKDISLSGNYNFYPQWWVGLGMKRKIGDKIADLNRRISETGSLRYEGDCLHVIFTVQKDHTKLRDLRPSTTYAINIQIPTF